MEAASLWAGVRFTARNGSPEALLTWGYQRSKVQIHGASELIRAHFNRLKPGVHDGVHDGS